MSGTCKVLIYIKILGIQDNDIGLDKQYKRGERESSSHRKRTKAIMVEGINPITTKKLELRILAATDKCVGVVRPRQHRIANN